MSVSRKSLHKKLVGAGQECLFDNADLGPLSTPTRETVAEGTARETGLEAPMGGDNQNGGDTPSQGRPLQAGAATPSDAVTAPVLGDADVNTAREARDAARGAHGADSDLKGRELVIATVGRRLAEIAMRKVREPDSR